MILPTILKIQMKIRIQIKLTLEIDKFLEIIIGILQLICLIF